MYYTEIANGKLTHIALTLTWTSSWRQETNLEEGYWRGFEGVGCRVFFGIGASWMTEYKLLCVCVSVCIYENVCEEIMIGVTYVLESFRDSKFTFSVTINLRMKTGQVKYDKKFTYRIKYEFMNL